MKKLLISLVAVVMLIGTVPACAFAAEGTVQSKLYKIHVVKNYAYVVGNKGVYRVKLKNKKPVSKKKIVKCSSKYGIDHLLVKGGYVYFKKNAPSAEKDYLYRVKKSGGKAKKLSTMGTFSEVAFKGSKIYYSYPGETDSEGKVLETIKKVMNLDGTGKADTEIEAVEKDKYSSKKGYKYKTKVTKKSVTLYLKTPKGKIALEKI